MQYLLSILYDYCEHDFVDNSRPFDYTPKHHLSDHLSSRPDYGDFEVNTLN